MVRVSPRIKTTAEKESRVEALRQKLGYPIKQRDPQGSDFWYLHPGASEADAEETAPIAIGFAAELNELTDERELQRLLTSKEWQQRIYGHYLNRDLEHKPVLYLLLPAEEGSGSVPLVLPTEGGLRQRNIQTFAWGSPELETRLNRLRQGALPIASKALLSIPLVERAFYEPIKTARELARLLAAAARSIEKIIVRTYKDEERRYPTSEGEDGYLHKLLRSFQQELLPSLKLASENEKDYSFSDIYAQTIAYSLFTARVFSYVRDQRQGNVKETLFDRESAWQQLPETNPFLRRLFQDVSEQSAEALGDELIGAIAEIFAILRAAEMEVILQDFRQRQNREDIVIRFYEDFLAAYKPEMRERRGVYYTPEPVVSYMVRSVDVLLKEKFNKPLGLADPEVMILDPACGTGTFLLQICQLIHDRFHTERAAIAAKVGDISWSEYVSDHLLPRIFGFELLMAPYAIAHLKLGLFLEETGYQFDDGKRLGIYLTNALEQDLPNTPTIPFEKFIAQEGEEALEIKRGRPIRVVLGNPPYSSSIYEGDWIMSLVQDYKQNLNEKKTDLNREEWKFLRFAQHKLDNVSQGIVSFVVNNTFTHGITHRSMRNSLLDSFSQIKVLDLKGSVKGRDRKLKKDDKNGEDLLDENVFDIQQGVAIFTGTKDTNSQEEKCLKFSELSGNREGKCHFLKQNNISSGFWQSLNPAESEYFFFCKKDFTNSEEYSQNWKISEVFINYVSGIQTKRDPVAIAYSEEDMLTILQDLITLDSEDFRRIYSVGADGTDWSISAARRNVMDFQPHSKHVTKITYRPFDYRWTWFTNRSRAFLGRPRYEVMKHIAFQDNLGLIAMKQIVGQECTHFGVTDQVACHGTFYLGNKGQDYVFPLYLYPETEAERTMGVERRPNLSQPFLNDITDRLGYTPTPEAIFYYIYAIFHSPTYRSRYAEFLKIDFPRVPLTRNDNLFRQLAAYGEELVALHLMKSAQLAQTSQQPAFAEQGGKCIVDPAHPKYEAKTRSVIINKKGDRFTDVPEAVWNFYVGGYPVCAKWLKDRKGRTLIPADITHYQRIVVALSETIRLMAAIDQAIPEFPIL